MCLRDVSLGDTTQRIVSENFYMSVLHIYIFIYLKEVPLLIKYSQTSTANIRIHFLQSSVRSIRRNLKLFARCKTSSENTVFELYFRILISKQKFSPFFNQPRIKMIVFCYTTYRVMVTYELRPVVEKAYQ
jgi:hypothetical protein